MQLDAARSSPALNSTRSVHCPPGSRNVPADSRVAPFDRTPIAEEPTEDLMRPPEELEAELVRARRRLHRLSGVMTFVFIVCLIVVFAAVGGALVVVDKRAARTLPAEANNTHQTASASQAPAPVVPPPARADAGPATTVAVAPTNIPSNPPPTAAAPPQAPAHANTAPPTT